jgi:hypothetical protein
LIWLQICHPKLDMNNVIDVCHSKLKRRRKTSTCLTMRWHPLLKRWLKSS